MWCLFETANTLYHRPLPFSLKAYEKPALIELLGFLKRFISFRYCFMSVPKISPLQTVATTSRPVTSRPMSICIFLKLHFFCGFNGTLCFVIVCVVCHFSIAVLYCYYHYYTRFLPRSIFRQPVGREC